MKKVFFAIGVMSVLASCAATSDESTTSTDSTQVVTDSTAMTVDSVAVDTTATVDTASAQ